MGRYTKSDAETHCQNTFADNHPSGLPGCPNPAEWFKVKDGRHYCNLCKEESEARHAARLEATRAHHQENKDEPHVIDWHRDHDCEACGTRARPHLIR